MNCKRANSLLWLAERSLPKQAHEIAGVDATTLCSLTFTHGFAFKFVLAVATTVVVISPGFQPET